MDDTTIVSVILNEDKAAYRIEVDHLVHWRRDNDLVLKTTKTKEIILDFRRTKDRRPLLLHIHK